MLELLGEGNTAALIGLIGGIALGLAARIGRFCTLGAIEDVMYSSDDRRMRMWGVSIGVAIIGVHIAMMTGVFDGQTSPYLDRSWNPIATILGGLLFGYGMAISGNCGYGALARLGGGDLRSGVLVTFIGLSAYFVMSGPLAEARIWLFPVNAGSENPQGIGYLFETLTGGSGTWFGIVIGLLILIGSIWSTQMLRSPKFIFWATVVGLAIISGWVGTYWVATYGFEAEPIESHAFAAPIGDTIYYSMTASGNTLSFSVGSVLGVVLGAFIGSFSKGHFRWEACEDPRELGRQIFGACLMGPGAILAIGCSVGQGLSAFSVLAYSAPVAFIAIFAGAAVGLRQLISGFSLSGA